MLRNIVVGVATIATVAGLGWGGYQIGSDKNDALVDLLKTEKTNLQEEVDRLSAEMLRLKADLASLVVGGSGPGSLEGVVRRRDSLGISGGGIGGGGGEGSGLNDDDGGIGGGGAGGDGISDGAGASDGIGGGGGGGVAATDGNRFGSGDGAGAGGGTGWPGDEEGSVFLSEGESKFLFDEKLFVAVQTVSFQGSPPRSKVYFSLSSPSDSAKFYEAVDVGFTTTYQDFSVTVASVNSFGATFRVMQTDL